MGFTSGYIMPYIPNINLQVLLTSPNVSIDDKVRYLKEVGLILEDLKRLREKPLSQHLFLNDIHEGNFVLNTATNEINVVDLDSCKISNNIVQLSKYLSLFTQLSQVSKYKLATKSVGGVFEIDDNTELYCYIVMIFNLFLGMNIAKMSIEEYYNYLDYLKRLGINESIINIFALIYDNADNQSPHMLLDGLIPFYEQMSKDSYLRYRG